VVQIGDAIVICDAGGGTVDLVSYEVKSLQPFVLAGLTAPSGKLGAPMLKLLILSENRWNCRLSDGE
jgi:hypothetical protein